MPLSKEIIEKTVALRHELHEHPELSLQETWTKQRLMDFLQDTTSLEICDQGKWFYAAWRGGGEKPGIAFRADFDALPIKEVTPLPYKSKIEGVSHKCGHDGHSAGLCAFAMDVYAKKPEANIFFVFQHAEEIGGGGEAAAQISDLENIAEVYGHHNAPGFPIGTLIAKNGIMQCSSEALVIEFIGKHSHASLPEEGNNPAPAMAQVVLAVNELLKDKKKYPDIVLSTLVYESVGSPNALGVNPGDGILIFKNRAEYEKEMKRLQGDIEKLAKEEAEKQGLKVEFSYKDFFPETKNWPEQFNKIKQVSENLKLPFMEIKEAIRGSEDFGYFTRKKPGCYFHIGAGVGRTNLHTPDFDYNDELIPIVSDVYWELLKF
ncbi:MAG: amidohydrolase [Spirochaetaceae bacterium]|jgi:amidohydrolase|nr:amidohydrolase [Spirochaetaceae bacterium]